MNNRDGLILVTGATGAQGGAVARQLLARGHRVRILTRDPAGQVAQQLVRSGAEAMRGDLDDATSVAAAMSGVTGVFSVQIPDVKGTDSERRHGFALVKAAVAAGVRQFVHTSVTGAGQHTQFPRWQTGYWHQQYWTDKWEIEQAVRAAGFDSWTVLKPAFMMDNFAQPKARFMFPHLREGKIATALLANTRMQLIAADDVGAFARAAFEQPDAFNRHDIDLAAQALTMAEVAATLSSTLQKPIVALELTPQEALNQGLSAGWVRSQEWSNEIGYRADIAALARYGIPLTSFEQWAHQHRGEIIVETTHAV
jgi:uncharacterized protein YbjT (DUF2867 family)